MRLIVATLLICAPVTTADASGYYLRFAEVRKQVSDKNGIASPGNTIETYVTIDKPFNVRSVIDGSQYLVGGVVKSTGTDAYSIEYSVDIAELRTNASPRIRINGTVAARLREPIQLGDTTSTERSKSDSPVVTRELTLFPFVPGIGFRDRSSGFAVQLVDASGRPVPAARARLAMESNYDNLIIGPGHADADGVVRFSEGRENLPTLTLFADEPKGKLRASANLDRGRFRGPGYGKPVTIEMKAGDSSSGQSQPDVKTSSTEPGRAAKDPPTRAMADDDAELTWIARRAEHEGAVLWVLMPEVVTPKSMPIRVIFANDSKLDCRLGETGYLVDCKINLVAEDGQRVPFTQHGMSLFSEGYNGGNQYGVGDLAPGGSRRWKYDLATVFTPLKPGKYLLSLETAQLRFKDTDAVVAKDQFGRHDMIIKGLPVNVK